MRYISEEEIDNMTRHHPPTSDDVVQAHQRVREMFKNLANELNEILPEGDTKTVCIRQKVREAQMWANAAIACDSPEEV